ncbi:MAG: ribonuclease III [Firmicutes bacterium]|jgi:ribonuclease III|nr:ribonuclease III [Bacillota bacterium]
MKCLEKMGIEIKNKELLETALTHSSYSNEHNCDNYERLEYLGDAILESVTSEYLYLNTDYSEGEMTKIRANYVCEKALATYSKKMGIDRYIRLGHGQINNLNDTIIADVFEAVAAAVYLDQGYEVVKKYLQDIIVPFIKEGWDFNTDYKTKLQEAVQTNKKSLEYVLIREYGEAHDKTFEMAVKIDNIIYGKGIGKSKKEAEQNAALDALNKSVVK